MSSSSGGEAAVKERRWTELYCIEWGIGDYGACS